MPHLHAYAGTSDIAVLKLNSSGVYQWHTFYGSLRLDENRSIASDGNGNIYISGYSRETWVGPGANEPLNIKPGYDDVVVINLSDAGAYQWHTFYGGVGCDVGNAGISDIGGNIFVAGYSTAPWVGPNSAPAKRLI